MTKWEYFTASFDDYDTTISILVEGDDKPAWTTLDKLGTEGWELIAVVPHQLDDLLPWAIFKRPIPQYYGSALLGSAQF
jgi:hypothetical protein